MYCTHTSMLCIHWAQVPIDRTFAKATAFTNKFIIFNSIYVCLRVSVVSVADVSGVSIGISVVSIFCSSTFGNLASSLASSL